MDHAILHGKPFGIPLILYRLVVGLTIKDNENYRNRLSK
jgi:hypothetical protein